jgi:hypothetical protein
MDERERRERAQLWARLASLESLDELSPAERARLSLAFEEIFADMLGFADAAALKAFLAKTDAEAKGGGFWLKQYTKTIQAGLSNAHAMARETLLPMMRGEAVAVRLDLQDLWSIADGKFIEVSKQLRHGFHADLSTQLRAALARILRGSKQPFGSCPQCGAVFVRVRRQRYCSPNCNAKALGDARRVGKAEYMRLYRKRQRATKSKTKKGA